MAEKTINTRILLKYDSYANWTTNNPVLKAGEVAIATIATGNTQEVNSVTAPQVLIKVGDGTSTYTALPFVSAKAADVYSWAKADKKPTYSASEITGISDYIAEYVETEMGISVDTDTQYQIVAGSDAYTYKLQSKGKGDSAWADVSTITIPKYDDTAVKKDITDIKALVGSTAVATQIANAVSALENGAVKANTDAIAAIKDGTTIDSFADVEAALAGKQATGDYATKTEAQGYANAKDAAITAAQNAADKAQGEVDALETVVAGKVDKVEGKGLSTNDLTDTLKANYDAAYTHSQASHAPANAQANVIESIKVNGTAQTITGKAVDITVPTKVSDLSNDAGYLTAHQDISGKADKTYVDAEVKAVQDDVDALAGRVGDNETAISTLNGTGAGSVSKTVADAINEFAAKVSDDGTVNTYKELIDYAAEHGAEFTELVGEVDANTKAIQTLNGADTVTGSVAKTVKDAIAAENLSQYATDGELSAVAGRVSTLEGEMDTAQGDIADLETEVAKKANDSELAAIAKSGNVNDLVQTSGDVLIFNCGDSNF